MKVPSVITGRLVSVSSCNRIFKTVTLHNVFNTDDLIVFFKYWDTMEHTVEMHPSAWQ